MKNVSHQSTQPNETAIQAIAYNLWKEAGSPAGKDLEFWFQAEARVGAKKKSHAPSPATTAEGGRKQHGFVRDPKA